MNQTRAKLERIYIVGGIFLLVCCSALLMRWTCGVIAPNHLFHVRVRNHLPVPAAISFIEDDVKGTVPSNQTTQLSGRVYVPGQVTVQARDVASGSVLFSRTYEGVSLKQIEDGDTLTVDVR